MTLLRWLIGFGGVVIAGYGVLLVAHQPPVVIMRIAVWALVAVVLHDFVFAPASAVLGFAGRRLIPASRRAPLAVAALCSVVLVLLAVPVYGKPGLRPDNLTVLDRDFPLGLWVSLGAVWLAVLVYFLLVRLLPIGQDHMVEHQRAQNIDGEPPSV